MTLENILELIRESYAKDSKLYFVTRVVKPGVAKRCRAKDKYLFKVYQIDCNKEVQESLYNTSINQIDKTIKLNFEMVDMMYCLTKQNIYLHIQYKIKFFLFQML